jgi:hypothetical protein
MSKIGRNDPCPCGSGKKFKQCCANKVSPSAEPPAQKKFEGAVPRATAWLSDRHRKAVSVAIDNMLFDGLNDEQRDTLQSLDADTWQGVQINATEWLLAEGSILVKGKPKRVMDCLLAPGGPMFTVEQRDWIVQLSQRPLRLYAVTDVIPGKQITICDALDDEAEPVVVREVSGSYSTDVGMLVGYRVMQVENHWELSGGVYPFSMLMGGSVQKELLEAADKLADKQEELASTVSAIIRHRWLEQFYAPVSMPTMMDARTGKPMLLITDHYRVIDWSALEQALAAQHDVEGDRKAGWSRLMECDDRQTRPLVAINPGKGADRVTLFYSTQGYADRGRPWFDELAGTSVKFISREISDPNGVMAKAPKQQKQGASIFDSLDLSAADMTNLVERTMQRIYANWPDESIPALGDKTPMQAMRTPAGLERVKGLLRSYEANERAAAAEQKRRPASFEFLWRKLGITA